MTDSVNDPGRDDPLAELARMLAAGEIKLAGVRTRVCGRCRAGTLEHRGTPDWQNRFVCDRCGAGVSL